ncbi:MAG: DUF1491 family protein [Pseudomonadota bacterium]
MEGLTAYGSEPRIKAGIWAAAYVRRCSASGAFAAISRRGDASAGTIFIEILHRSGTDLYGPAPAQPARRFERIMESAPPAAVVDRLEREISFDSDLWVITVEDPQGRTFLEPSERG